MKDRVVVIIPVPQLSKSMHETYRFCGISMLESTNDVYAVARRHQYRSANFQRHGVRPRWGSQVKMPMSIMTSLSIKYRRLFAVLCCKIRFKIPNILSIVGTYTIHHGWRVPCPSAPIKTTRHHCITSSDKSCHVVLSKDQGQSTEQTLHQWLMSCLEVAQYRIFPYVSLIMILFSYSVTERLLDKEPRICDSTSWKGNHVVPAPWYAAVLCNIQQASYRIWRRPRSSGFPLGQWYRNDVWSYRGMRVLLRTVFVSRTVASGVRTRTYNASRPSVGDEEILHDASKHDPDRKGSQYLCMTLSKVLDFWH